MSAWSIEALGVVAPAAAAAAGSDTHAALSKEEGGVRETPQLPSAKAFLLSRPSGGVYTCARASAIRTRGSLELVLWEFHLERLAIGIRARVSSSERQPGDEGVWVAEMQRVTTALSEKLVRHIEPQSLSDLMLTVLWWTPPAEAPRSYNVSVHACTMPTPKSTTSTVLIHGHARENALCKHTQWIADRIPFEEFTAQVSAAHGPIHETILSSYDADRGDVELLEGLITNFFVVKGGSVVTAADGVLRGSTRELVLKACEELRIPVVFQAPRFAERELWDAAFVTSAVRLAISVTRVLWKSSSKSDEILAFELDAAKSDIVERIRRHIVDRQYFLSD